MKIAILTPVFPPYSGGMGNVAFHHARLLQQNGFEVEVLTPNYETKTLQKINFENIKTIKIPPLFKIGNAARLKDINKYLKDYDVIYLHYPFFGVAEKLLSSNKKIIIFYHMDVKGRGFKKIIFSAYNNLFLKKIINKAEKILVSSFDYVKNSDIKDIFKKEAQKFSEVPNGVEIETFYPAATPPNQIKNLLFVGGLDKAHYFKGINYLLSAFAILKNSAVLTIVGDGNLRFKYEQGAKQLNLKDKVIFAGNVSGKMLSEYYNNSDIVILPSIDGSEAFGMVLIEAMACSKPVVATNLPGVRSVVENGFNGLIVEPKDHIALSEAIDKFLQNPSLAKKMGENGRLKVLEKYSWQKIGQKLNVIFETLC